MRELVVFGLATAAMSFTISRSTMPLIRQAREAVTSRSGLMKELLHCPYCTANWVALAIVLIYEPRWTSGRPVADFVMAWQAIVGVAMAPIFGMMFIARQG